LCNSLQIGTLGSGQSQLRGRLVLSLLLPQLLGLRHGLAPETPGEMHPYPPQVSVLPLAPACSELSGPLQKSCSTFPREGSPKGTQLCEGSRGQWAKMLFPFSISEHRPEKINSSSLHLCIFSFPTFSAVFLLS